MSDTKLRPEDLTSEERAIVDNAALFYRRVTGDVGETAEWAYVEALKEAEPIILARRALFAPAPEKVAKVETGTVPCPNCGVLGLDEYDHRKLDQFGTAFDKGGGFTCQPAPPAPEKAAKVECPNCGEMTERSHSRYEGPGPDKWACQSAPPEPAAHEDAEFLQAGALAMARIIERDEQPEPASPEMPEALAFACSQLRQVGLLATVEKIKHYWRNLAQPVAVGMTEELKRVLDFAAVSHKDANADTRVLWDQEYLVAVGKAIAAVRQQAAQGRKVELGKARKMLEYMRRCAWHEETYQQIEEALAELDAAEKGEGRG